jgi:tRNA A37 threonylcarbamoyladenosine biosynthesis protein TsaE
MNESHDNTASIIYYLNLLHFIRESSITKDEINDISIWLNNSNRKTIKNDENEEDEIIPNNIIEECKDEILKLCYVRDAKNVTIFDPRTLIYNKRQYHFNNIFNSAHDKEDEKPIINEMIIFMNKRISMRKNISVIVYGLSGSGKTTLFENLIKNLDLNQCTYKLYEIYLNKIYIFYQNFKTNIELNDLNNDKYFFKTGNIIQIIEKFSRKSQTNNNKTSSRSHIIIEIKNKDNTIIKLIDLAGNEKLKAANNTTLEESKFINNSLYSVSRYIQKPSYINNKCKLLQIVKSTKNLVFTMIMHDNLMSLAGSLLNIFADVLKIFI